MRVKVYSNAVSKCESPKWDACYFGKGCCQPNKIKTSKKNPIKDQNLRKDNILPGQVVYSDHYILQYLGRLYHTKGKSYPYEMFSGGFVLIDHQEISKTSPYHHIA